MFRRRPAPAAVENREPGGALPAGADGAGRGGARS
jgi:hypothetical protein